MNGAEPVVVNENTLGVKFYLAKNPYIQVLAGKRDWKNGCAYLSPTAKVRPATQADFEKYRVDSRGYL